MKQSIYTIGTHSIGFSPDSIRKRYSKKEDFIADVSKANEHIEKKALNKVLDKVWNEAYPKEEKADKTAE